ncbi:hypothetical protein LTR37_012723 [Vermiconidia calcicola]|uniref:Uncharacterized protein n=1 Tax=Vermiconidia calcicola TaxID=1690605 RepID=A0ACC3N1E8_9PEZI|nr:hypothetical protein LTR37_012723 [Vermiconidia calcicola]
MAGQILDPQTLHSWEDAFQHPLPIVRKLEQQLRRNIDDNRQKLRSLVGASYRDLLGTAERIIEMDQQMETVETHLGDIGRKCNARTIERISDNHSRMRKTSDARHEDKHGTMAQTKILQNALNKVSRIIKAGGDALQASKLFVLARLLYKSVSESPQAPSVLEDLRRKLTMLRKKLLLYVERMMRKPSADKTLQAHTLSAYGLVTSSTPKDVLRHFLQVRYEQLDGKSDSPSEADILQMLDLFSQTLLDTRDLFPRRFAESLAQLAKVPLLQDDQVRSVFELNLDIYGGWLAADVQAFTPWVRHEQLTTSEVNEAIQSWTGQAQDCLLNGVQDHLHTQRDAQTIVHTRRKVLSKYMGLNSKFRNDTHLKAINAMREVFMKRLEELVAEAAAISNFALAEAGIPGSDNQVPEQQIIWDLASRDLDPSQGALLFRQSVIQIRQGRSFSIQREIEKLDSWTSRILKSLDLVDDMRTRRWDMDIDFQLEDLDNSDSSMEALNKVDPNQLQDKLHDATEASLGRVIDHIQSVASSTEHAGFYLRTWREVDRRHRVFQDRLRVSTAQISLTVLHRNIARSVSAGPIDEYVRSAKTPSRAAVTLWDGSPPLPVQPSPATFRFFITLHRAMSAAGDDLWSPEAVRELKGVLIETLVTRLDDLAFSRLVQDSERTNGHLENADGNDEIMSNGIHEPVASTRDRLLQNLFDMQYLSRICSDPGKEKPGLGELGGIVETIKTQLELDDSMNERMKKSTSEYWKRTYLLFGLLAPGSGD